MSKKCLIFGSGFGLYGYLPAVINNGYKVVLPQRYKGKLEARRDLTRFAKRVEYIPVGEKGLEWKTVLENMNKNDLVVIAKRPEDQSAILSEVFKTYEKVSFNLMLEKPLSFSPESAKELCALLKSKAGSSRVRLGYTFLYTDWGEALRRALDTGVRGSVCINWVFKAHHFKNNLEIWKRDVSKGGGSLRFYGIQIIGVLAAYQGWEIRDSMVTMEDDHSAVAWDCELRNDRVSVGVHVDSRSDIDEFLCSVNQDGVISYEYRKHSPFQNDEEKAYGNDVRVVILEKIIRSFEDGKLFCTDVDYITHSIDLWKNIEDNTVYMQKRFDND